MRPTSTDLSDPEGPGRVLDVTEQRAASELLRAREEALREKQERLEAALSASGTGTYRWDIRTDALQWDENLERLFGLPPGRRVGSLPDFVALVHPADRASVVDLCRRCAADGSDFALEFRVVWPDGTVHWLDDRGKTYRGADGRPAYMTGACVDVTARRERDAALAASEAKFRQLADAMPQIVWAAAADGRVDYYNQRWYELTGAPPGEEDWAAYLHPDDVERTARAWRASLAAGVPHESELRLRFRADDSFRWFLVRSVPVRDDAGAVVRWYGTSTDIHDRWLSENAVRERDATLRRTLAYASAGLWSLTFADGSVECSPENFELLGIAPGTSLRDRPWERWIHAEDLPRVDAALREVMEGRTEHYRVEFRVAHPQRGTRWILGIGRAEQEPDGKPRRLLGLNLDITQRREAEEALRQANDRLRSADRRKDEFLAMLSHELRNPLVPIRNSAHVLEHAAPDGEQAARARAVLRRQSEHLTRLVDDLLDVTRITQGKISLRTQVLDLRETVIRAAEDFRLTLADRGIRFRMDLPEAGVWATADDTRLNQVITNLLHNAAKFTPRGGEVVATLRPGAGWAELCVRDTGAGIDPALLPHVFDPFVQGERTLARSEGGLGLGLALVRGIVELHGGEARAESGGVGAGAEFVIRLPTLAHDARPRSLDASRHPAAEGRRVLIIDDNVDAAESLADLLRLQGHRVETAFDGPGALARLEAANPDVVLCDIGLPGMSGYEVAQAIRRLRARQVRIVALTGYAQAEDVARALAAGFDTHLAKPPDPEKLAGVLA